MTELVDALKYAKSIKFYSKCDEALKQVPLQEAINIRLTPRTPPPKIRFIGC